MRYPAIISAIVMMMPTAVSLARPRLPAASMSVLLPREFSRGVLLPLKLQFRFETDEDRSISTESISFVLLGEDGQQVAVDPFDLADSSKQTTLKGKEPAFEPAVKFDPYYTDIVAGKKYQLVCTWQSSAGELAGSAWFTLTE
jgi:hypothetical protein